MDQEIPSCIESLAGSCEQLRQLAEITSRYYIKSLLCFAYVYEQPAQAGSDISPSIVDSPSVIKGSKSTPQRLSLSKLTKDRKTLESLDATVRCLPLLNQLSNFVERCCATVESTLKRCTYYLNRAETGPLAREKTTDDVEFTLKPGTRLDLVFVALMDLSYALVSLDQTIRSHTGIATSLETLKFTCDLIRTCPPDQSKGLDDLNSIGADRLLGLKEYISNIQLTLFNEQRTTYRQCLEHVQHLDLILSADKTNKGYATLCDHFEKFIWFYIDQLNADMANSQPSGPTNTNQLINSHLLPSLQMTSAPKRALGLMSTYVLYTWLFKKPPNGKKTNRLMMQLLQRSRFFLCMNPIPLIGSNSYILSDEFMSNHLPKPLVETKILRQLHDQSKNLLKLNTCDEFDRLTLTVYPWLVKLKTESQRYAAVSQEISIITLGHQYNLLQRGLDLARQINGVIKSVVSSYLHYNQPMTKNNLIPLWRLVALLKSIWAAVDEEQLFARQVIANLEARTKFEWQKLMIKVQKRLLSLKYSERKLDINSMMTLTSICANTNLNLSRGPGRRSIISLCLSMLLSSFDTEETNQLNWLLSHLPTSDFFSKLKSETCCDYLFWSLPTFATYYNYAFEENPGAIDEVHYFHMALSDITELFSLRQDSRDADIDLQWLLDRRNEFQAKLEEQLVDQFRCNFLDRLCQELEIELRLQTHQDLHLDGHNPFRRQLYNFKQMFKVGNDTFRIFNKLIPTRYYVEQRLSKVCYNLTSVAPSDWFAYDTMNNLAKHKYNLQFANSQLPTQTLDYGLDLLDITRNLALFVTRYGYDLTNQMFIEKCSAHASGHRIPLTSSASVSSIGSQTTQNAATTVGAASSVISPHSVVASSLAPNFHSQMLNVLQVKHIASSIQSHGYGVLNSAVNCTYRLMKRLINLFSKQMSDARLRATLSKEQALLAKQPEALTYERAFRLAKRFKLNSVALPETATTPAAASETHHHQQQQQQQIDLDSLRQSITQLGNLLAFIRLLKSGALSCASKSVDYLPNLNVLTPSSDAAPGQQQTLMADMVKSEFRGYHEESLRTLEKAASNFDQCLADFSDNFSPKTNYFNIIINLFKNLLAQAPNENSDKQQKTDHLRLFHLLLPALTINYIDHLIASKDRVSLRSRAARFGALLSDDGFPMGVAFLLTVLPGEQAEQFAKLQWLKRTVRNKLEADKQDLEKKLNDSRYEESLKQTANMTLRRLQRLRLEYDGLDFSLSSALLFFRSSLMFQQQDEQRTASPAKTDATLTTAEGNGESDNHPA